MFDRGQIFERRISDRVAEADQEDADKIIDLLERNLGEQLSEEGKERGFVTWKPSQEYLLEAINEGGVFVSRNENDGLRGYAITISKELALKEEFFQLMIAEADKMQFDGKSIGEYGYAVFAQICIEEASRNGMLFAQLHAKVVNFLKERGYDLFVGEIVDDNTASLSVHRMYSDVGEYVSPDGLRWHVIVGDLREAEE